MRRLPVNLKIRLEGPDSIGSHTSPQPPLLLGSSRPPPPSPSSATPVYDRLATSKQPPSPTPIKLVAVPRVRPLVTQDPSTPRPLPSPVSAVDSSTPMTTEPDSQSTDDGPLFRAHLASLEKRSASLRSSLKKLQRAVEASVNALQANSAAQAIVDEALEELSAGSLTAQSEVLGGLFERELRGLREEVRDAAERELERGKELSERMKGASDRIKGVEERKKGFEAESKRYYDDLAKYLGRGDSDAAKNASLDSKQADRAATFKQQRIDYFSFLEGLVESEEGAVASWLRAWATTSVPASKDRIDSDSSRESARQASLAALEGTAVTSGRSQGSLSKEEWIHVGGLPDYIDPDSIAVGEPTLSPVLSPLQFPSAPTPVTQEPRDSGPPSVIPPSTDDKARRRRRSSIPHFHFASHEHPREREREPSGGKRDRIKGLLNKAHSSLQAALPSSASSPALASEVFYPRPSPPLPMSSPTLSMPLEMFPTTQHLSSPVQSLSPPPAHPSFPRGPSRMRRKEGFLYATETGQKHTSAGDGGARWYRYWVTLAEGQLVEYDKWQDVMSVHGTPINLRYATARMSKTSDRRFTFEVLTPTLRRVFQAANEKECDEWVTAVSKSVESLLNGTSSVRHFDASHLTGHSTPYSLNDFGSSVSLARPTPSPSSQEPPPISPKSRLPDFLSRRASFGHGPYRRISTSKKDKRRSQQVQVPALPALMIGGEAFGSLAAAAAHANDGAPVDRKFFDASSRRGLFAFSEGNEAPDPPPGAARPTLNGLGIPFPSFSAASKSSPDLLAPSDSHGHRSASSPFPGGSTEGSLSGDGHSEGLGDDASSLCEQDRAISDAVRGWASDDGGGGSTTRSFPSAFELEEAKYRKAARIVEIAERGGEEWQNDRCADCREENPRWTSWSLGITLCIRCSGVHRSLGTHVSKVRSVELDDWSDEQIAQMEAVGNFRSNQFFEAHLPLETIPNLDASTIGQHIRQKYVEKAWASSVSSPPSKPTSIPPPT
ncbi:hypothetical protein JCM11641_002999 [Rhodosporidiobolus odoratus]